MNASVRPRGENMRRFIGVLTILITFGLLQTVVCSAAMALPEALADKLELDLTLIEADALLNPSVWYIEDSSKVDHLDWGTTYLVNQLSLDVFFENPDRRDIKTLEQLLAESQDTHYFTTLDSLLTNSGRNHLAHAIYRITDAGMADQVELSQNAAFAKRFRIAETRLITLAGRLGEVETIRLYRLGIQYFLAAQMADGEWILPVPLRPIEQMTWEAELWSPEEVIQVLQGAVQDSDDQQAITISFDSKAAKPEPVLSRIWSVWLILPLTLLLFVAAVLIIRRKLLEDF